MKKIIGLGIFCLFGIIGCSEPSPNIPKTDTTQQKDTIPPKKVETPEKVNILSANSKKIEGTYLHGDAQKGGAYLAIQEKEGNKLRFQLNLYRGAPNHNSGYIEDQMTYVDNVATYITTEEGDVCKITFTFSKDKVTLSQVGTEVECGFGAGVYAGGELRRTNTKAVFLDENGAPIE